MSTVLELQHVTKVYGGGMFRKVNTLAVDDVTFAIDEDRPMITALAGESGSGKSTLARLLLGTIKPTAGQVLYRGRDLHKMSRKERREYRREVQPIFQDPFEVYNPFYKVDHVLDLPLRKFRMAGSKREIRRMMGEALELVGLQPDETLGRHPHQLSGGQRQRVMVARALLLKPRIILADEPVSMVDASLRATILEAIQRLNRQLGIAVIYITHDLTTAYQVADNIVILYRGSVVEAGDVDSVIKEPKHPYTQLLVESIPQPDPEKRWGENVTVQNRLGIEPGQTACKFADRCPVAMPMCAENVPPLYRINSSRGAVCFLYRDTPVLPTEEISEMMSKASEREPIPVGSPGNG